MNITLPNGTVMEGVPEGTSKEVIMRKAITAGLASQEDFAPKQKVESYADQKTGQQQALESLASEQGPVDATLIGIGKGLYDIGRGLGIVEPPGKVEKESFAALEEKRPYTTGGGEIVGQSLPFLVPGGAIGRVATLPGRVAASTALGATEGGLITKGQGGDLGDVLSSGGVGGVVAGGIEAILPALGRVGRKIYSNVRGRAPEGALLNPDGTPTPEMQSALDQSGLTWESMKLEAKDMVAKQSPGASAEQTARLASFEEIGAPALKGEVTQDLAQQKLEQGLIESTSESSADAVRSTKLAQSEAFKGELDNIIDGLGVSGETGDAIKDALSTRKTTLKADRKNAYEALGREMTRTGEAPVSGQPLIESLPDKGTIRDIATMSPNQYKAINDILVEFGVEQGDEAVESALSRGIEITPLSLGNFERLRKRLNAIERSDQTGATSVLTGPIKKALDDEIDLAASALERTGNENVSQLAKQARQSNVALKTEFDDKKITSKLIDSVAKWSDKPKIEASQAYQKIMAPSTPVEDLDRVLTSLRKEGGKGNQAIKEMQGQAVLDLMDSAFNAGSRKISGQRVFGATPFSKAYEKQLPKLERLFKGSPKEMKRLNNMYKRSQDIIPPSSAMPKGSAGYFIDALNKAGMYSIATKIPGASMLFELAKDMGEKGAKRKVAEKAIDANPQVRALSRTIDRDYPQIAAALGIAGISAKTKENQNQTKR